MRAAVFKGPGQPLVIETIADPEPGAGEAVIRVQRCGVCGTDLNMTSGHGMDAPLNSVIGHEYCGEVVALGAGVEGLKVGQFVTAMPATGCGRCIPCLSGFPLGCAQMQGMVGGFGEYMRIAVASTVILPQSLSMADGALVEPVAVGDGLPTGMPIFLSSREYVPAPLEATYQTTWAKCPEPLKDLVVAGGDHRDESS